MQWFKHSNDWSCMNVKNFEHELSILIFLPQMLLFDFSNHGKNVPKKEVFDCWSIE